MKLSPAEHGRGQSRHEGRGLGMQIAEDGVGVPPPEEANSIGVNAATEEGHGATGPGGAG